MNPPPQPSSTPSPADRLEAMADDWQNFAAAARPIPAPRLGLLRDGLHELAEASEQTFVVTGVPDDKKGERLVVLHNLPEEKLRIVLEKLGHCDLPNLWLPRPNQFFQVVEFPQLGTGNLDLRRVRELALSLQQPV